MACSAAAAVALLLLLLLLLSSCRGCRCCCCSKWLRGIECIETEAVPTWRVEERGRGTEQQGWHTSASSPGWTRELAWGTAGYEMRILAQFATHSNSCTQQTVTVTALWGNSPQLPHKTGHLKPAKRAESINRSNKNAKGNLTKIAHNLPNSRCAYPTALLPLPLLSLSLSAATQDESPRTPRWNCCGFAYPVEVEMKWAVTEVRGV